MPPNTHQAETLNVLTSVAGGGKNYRLVSKGKIGRYVQKIKSNSRSEDFAKRLKSDKALQGIFLQHWKQLSLVQDVSIPVLFSAPSSNLPEELLRISSKTGNEQVGNLVHAVFEEAKPQIVTAIEQLRARLKEEGINLAEAQSGMVMPFLFQSMGLFSGGSPLATLVRLIKPYEDLFIDEALEVGLSILEPVKAGVIENGFARRRIVLQNSGLSIDEYEKAVRGLVDEEFLRPGLSVLWCAEHGKYPRSMFLAGHLALPRIAKCDLCGRDLDSGNFLVCSSTMMPLVRPYEGAIPVLLAWDLERQGLKWISNCYLEGEEGDLEKDLVFQREGQSSVGIVECKSYYRDTNDRVVKDNIASMLHQLEKQAESYTDRSIPVEVAILAVNYEITSELRDFVREELKKGEKLRELNRLGVKVVGSGSIEREWFKN